MLRREKTAMDKAKLIQKHMDVWKTLMLKVADEDDTGMSRKSTIAPVKMQYDEDEEGLDPAEKEGLELVVSSPNNANVIVPFEEPPPSRDKNNNNNSF